MSESLIQCQHDKKDEKMKDSTHSIDQSVPRVHADKPGLAHKTGKPVKDDVLGVLPSTGSAGVAGVSQAKPSASHQLLTGNTPHTLPIASLLALVSPTLK